MKDTITVHTYGMKSGIRRTRKFAEKRLADFAVNIGTKCSHGCTYCSSGAMLCRHRSFKAVGRSAFENGYAIVDDGMPGRVAHDAARKRGRGLVQLCTTVDAWDPGSQHYNLGRRCLEAILAQPGWTVRVLTKNAAVSEDFDVIRRHRDRVSVGLSITGTPGVEKQIRAIEPDASTISERMKTLRKAHALGLRTYAMFCPLLPGISDNPDQIEELVAFAREIDAEEIFVEAVNPRGRGLKATAAALRAARYLKESRAIAEIVCRDLWSRYVADLIAGVQRVVRKHGLIQKLRFLLYPGRLLDHDLARIQRNGDGVIWLGKDNRQKTPAAALQGDERFFRKNAPNPSVRQADPPGNQ